MLEVLHAPRPARSQAQIKTMTPEQFKIFLKMMSETADLHEKSARLLRHAISLDEAGDIDSAHSTLLKCRALWKKRYEEIVITITREFPDFDLEKFTPGNPARFSQN